jgi:hypothetical protein
MAAVSAESAGILFPHVLGILALAKLVILLPSVGFEVVDILLTESVAIVSTEF